MATATARIDFSPEEADCELLSHALFDGMSITLRGDWGLTNAAKLRTEILSQVRTQPQVNTAAALPGSPLSGVGTIDNRKGSSVVRDRQIGVPSSLK
ncbi:hypothetical protein [Tenggerimyces flavus]|uniref:Uncharacterized protein n=1 Tax=Tenggerimyces flavus TaxID=1708749 RepID=A0ABV7YMY7_9ACTN|nr:hypothetical protein [Tenggerimyces flavus]MBM7786514.1 hypothetical protein [Tenggerimyces flavus]